MKKIKIDAWQFDNGDILVGYYIGKPHSLFYLMHHKQRIVFEYEESVMNNYFGQEVRDFLDSIKE